VCSGHTILGCLVGSHNLGGSNGRCYHLRQGRYYVVRRVGWAVGFEADRGGLPLEPVDYSDVAAPDWFTCFV
jgi:hypothetical protein